MLKKVKRKITYCLLATALISWTIPSQVLAAPSDTLPNSFTKLAENERLVLYSDMKKGEIAVKDKKENKIWWSNPQDASTDKIASGTPKMALSSQITARYVDASNAFFSVTSKLNSVDKGGLTSKKIDNGIIFTMDFSKEQFSIPVKYTLEKDYLKAEMLVGEISEYGDKRIMSIGLLPFFGAGGLNDEGYIMVPDGSGALINFNNGKKFASEYSEQIYGTDYTYDRTIVNSFEEQIAMPVFGIKNNDGGFLAVVAQNETQGIIKASASGKLNSYNNAYAEYIYRSMGSMSLTQKNFQSKSTIIIERNPANKGSFEVRYYFLGEGKNDYNGMAETYRQYLMNEKNLKLVTKEGDIPFYLDLYGYVKKKKPILGVPFEKIIPLTEFKDSEEIVSKLNAGGIKNTVLRYNGWVHDAYLEKIPSNAKVEKKLGGEKELKNLYETVEKNGGQMYLNVDFLDVYKTGNGFSKFGDAAMTVVNAPAMQYLYRINIYDKDHDKDPWYLLSPKSIAKFAEKFLDSFSKLNLKNLALENIGTKVYSDLGLKSFERWKVPSAYEEVLSITKDKVGTVMADGGNAYVLPYAQHIVNSPSYSSKFDIEDEVIPFYQIVLHGLVSYSVPSINLSSNPEIQKLRCLETGSYPMYSWIAKNTEELKNTRLDYLYSADYQTWINNAIDEYKEVNSILSKVATKKIISHKKLGDGINQTTYEGGMSVIVNYNSNAATVEGRTINGLGYIVLSERG